MPPCAIGDSGLNNKKAFNEFTRDKKCVDCQINMNGYMLAGRIYISTYAQCYIEIRGNLYSAELQSNRRIKINNTSFPITITGNNNCYHSNNCDNNYSESVNNNQISQYPNHLYTRAYGSIGSILGLLAQSHYESTRLSGIFVGKRTTPPELLRSDNGSMSNVVVGNVGSSGSNNSFSASYDQGCSGTDGITPR